MTRESWAQIGITTQFLIVVRTVGEIFRLRQIHGTNFSAAIAMPYLGGALIAGCSCWVGVTLYFFRRYTLSAWIALATVAILALVQTLRARQLQWSLERRGPTVSEEKSIAQLFRGRHFDREVIILCVRWYLRYKLSSRDLVEITSERGLHLAHTTILRWVQRYAPEFIKRWNRFGWLAGRSWRVDKTYIKVRGQWTYLYRAVDKCRQTIDFKLGRTGDASAAMAFFKKAIRHEGQPPKTITLDGYAASHRAVREMRTDRLLPERTKLRSSKYLNNLIEQDHRGINPELDRCSASKTLTAQQPLSLE